MTVENSVFRHPQLVDNPVKTVEKVGFSGPCYPQYPQNGLWITHINTCSVPFFSFFKHGIIKSPNFHQCVFMSLLYTPPHTQKTYRQTQEYFPAPSPPFCKIDFPRFLFSIEECRDYSNSFHFLIKA